MGHPSTRLAKGRVVGYPQGMSKFVWFAYFQDKTDPDLRLTDGELTRALDIVAETPALAKGLVFTPWDVAGLYFDDGPAPQLALELYFDEIEELEGALAPDGHLQALAEPGTLPSLAKAEMEQQGMVARSFPVPDPEFRTPEGEPHCSYLVHYPGAAEDLNAWMAYYVANHTREMAHFPDIRQIEVCSRLDWCGFLPWPRVDYMQRNKVVFDDGEALKAATTGPVIQAMRADFHKFPPFTGNNVHHAMATHSVGPGGR